MAIAAKIHGDRHYLKNVFSFLTYSSDVAKVFKADDNSSQSLQLKCALDSKLEETVSFVR